MWCSLRHIQVTQSVLDMLTLLSLTGRTEISKFCEDLTKTELFPGLKQKSFSGKEKLGGVVFKSTQSARNTIIKAIEQGLIIRIGRKHQIEINPSMNVINDDNLLVNYQLLTLGSS